MFNTEVAERIQELSCARAASYAEYVFHKPDYYVHFGKENIKYLDLCAKFSKCPASAFLVTTLAGPPGKKKWRLLTLADLIQEWYYCEVVHKNQVALARFHRSLLGVPV